MSRKPRYVVRIASARVRHTPSQHLSDSQVNLPRRHMISLIHPNTHSVQDFTTRMASLIPGKAVKAADKAIMAMSGENHPRVKEAASKFTPTAKDDPSGRTMQAVKLNGTKSIEVSECPKPTITDDSDVIIRMTSSAICGTDLHMYVGAMPGMSSGHIMGHEAMGIVEEVGPQVKNIKRGDRVVASCIFSCGECYFCKREEYSACEFTNPSASQEKMMGARTAGIMGHPVMNGGWAGGQSDYFRVPNADVNCLVVPADVDDHQVLFLSDILCTAWHANELADVKQGDVLAIYGAGPVGLLSAQCAFARGARRVIVVDKVSSRLQFAKEKIDSRIEIVDISNGDAAETKILELCKNEPAGAPDCVIEAVGFHYSNSVLHRFEMAVGMESDSPEALNSAMVAVKKYGKVAAIGAYAGFANHFNIGTLMQKGLTVASGPVLVQRYWKKLLQMIFDKKLNPAAIITHDMSLSEAPAAYQQFNDKVEGVVKVVLHPTRHA